MPAALGTVHAVLYLLFNEGHLSASEKPISVELCLDAMSLTKLLIDAPTLSNSDTVALMALMCLVAARLESRVDADGNLIPLDRQDRARWDRGLISQGLAYLGRTTLMETVQAGRFHLEAAIASRHCDAASFAETNWPSICNLYDRLIEVAPSPLAKLNRAVAISYRDGATAAIPLVEEIRRSGDLPHTHSLAAVLANLYMRAGSPEPARAFLNEALSRALTEHERNLLELQIQRATEAG